jgi:hypothetical protein
MNDAIPPEVCQKLLNYRFMLGVPVLVLAPLWVPLAIVKIGVRVIMCIRASWEMARLAEKYREPSLTAIRPPEDDDPVAATIAELTPAFLECGFELLGDYQTKSEPLPVRNRYFVGPRGTVFGDITWLMDTCCPGFFSILADGTLVETSGVDEPDSEDVVDDMDLLCINYGADRSVGELLRLHIDALRREATRRRTKILSFQTSQLLEVAIYGQRRFWTWRQRMGDATGPVPPCVVPRGVTVDASQIRFFPMDSAVATVVDGHARYSDPD